MKIMIQKIQILRLQRYRELLEYKVYLKMFQQKYNMLPEILEGHIRQCEIKLLTDTPLDRNDKVFLNELERTYQRTKEHNK